MEENTALTEFAKQVREQLDKLNAAKGNETEQMQAAMSTFITEQTMALMKQGLPVLKIQEALQAATDMPQTHTPKSSAEQAPAGEGSPPDDTGDDAGGALEAPVASVTHFLPMEQSIIVAFTAGKMSNTELMELLYSSPDAAQIEMTDGLDLVLTDYGKNMALDDATGGGEIVAGPDGEAFMPENLEMRYLDGSCDTMPDGSLAVRHGTISEPMVFKTSEEVKSLQKLLEPVTQNVFYKKADIKKLIKAGWLADYDKKSVKKEADFIIGELWKEFVTLKKVYRKAAEQQKGMVVFMGYEGS